MKKTLIPLFLFVIFTGYSQNWTTDFSKAKEFASSQNKTILLVFSGSDWCGPCIKMEKDIWSSEEFIKYADEHLIMLKADFPRKKKNKLSKEQQVHNDNLAEKYQARFPKVVLLNSKGEVLDSFGYIKNFVPQDYISRISKLL